MVKKIDLLLLFIVSFFYINSNCYSLNMDQYEYTKINNITTRHLKTDTILEKTLGGANIDTSREALMGFSYIPGVNILVSPLAYMIQIGIISGNSDAINNGDVSAVSDIAMIGGMITDILSPSDAESNAAIAIQQTFNTNLYCKHQKFYIEEEEYISKQKSASGGGYSIFPVYPMDIPVSKDTWQCDIDKAIDTYFLDGQLIPQNSKCSYSYSATSDQCVIDLNIPILSEYAAVQLTVEGLCLASSIKGMTKQAKEAAEKASKEAMEKASKEAEEAGEIIAKETLEEIGDKASKKAIKKAKKAGIEEIIATVAEVGALTGVNLFFDSRLAFDPIMMYAIIQIELAIDFVVNLPLDIAGGDWGCIIARIASLFVLDILFKTTTAATLSSKYEQAKNAIKNITFCGYDWLSYKKTNDEKYYIRGMFKHSRYKNVSDCINGKSCLLNNENTCENTIQYPNWCDGINSTSKNIKNKIFREYTYGGKEYEVKDKVENDIKEGDNRHEAMGYDPDYCIDPRLPEYKGFISMAQRYYMKGNEKANFACNRFFYNHNDGCILPEKDIANEDKNILIPFTKENNVNYYIIEKSSGTTFNKYALACKNAFIEARKCCKYRSRHFVCLENKDKKSNDKYKFCFSNVVDKYGDPENTSLFTYLSTRDADEDKVTCTIDGYNFEATKKKRTNHICVFSDGFCPYNFKLNAGLNYRASYCDANYFSNYKDHSDALKRTATQYNAADCREGLFSGKMREEYKKIHSNTGGELLASYTHYKVKNDMFDYFNYNKDDFTTIYDFDRLLIKTNKNYVPNNYSNAEINNIKNYGLSKTQAGSDIEKYVLNSLDIKYANQIKTSAYGQIKNFCQYRAHCVEVEREREYMQDSSISALFLDSSCNGSSQHSRNILQTHNGGIPRQLSTPIVECIYESLKNLVNGVIGMSSCIDGSTLNIDGYCDEDTKEIIDYKLNKNDFDFFEGRYNKYGDTYIVKGTILPDDYNPFIKLQKYFINIVKTALCLFLVLYSYKKLILVEMDLLNRKNIMNLTRQIVKFSIVVYLVFSNGWRSGIYDYIVNFSTSAYDFVNKMFIKVVQNPKNQILNLSNSNGTVIKVVKEDNITGKDIDITICYRYNFFNNIEFAIKDGAICEKGFKSKKMSEILISTNKNFPKQENNCRLIFSNNQEISRLLYYVDKYNKNTTQKLKIKVSTGGEKITTESTQCTERTSWNDIDSINNGLWNKDYDGCYFDTTEYQNNKQYISFFDTLDCKMMKYLGYSTNSAVPNMLIYSAIMLLPQYFFPNMGILSKIVSGLGSMIFGFMLTFLFLMLNVILKAVYLFTSSFFILSILIFLSPIILPMMLFEKTTGYYNKWFEQVLGTILKPSFGLALLILYVNLMDIMLIGNDVIFNNHNNIGRDANVICSDNAVSFFCLINKNPVEAYEILSIIFNGGLLDLLISIIIAFLFFKLSDSFLNELNGMIEKIFTGIGSASGLTGINGIHSGGTTDALNKAKSYGKKMEDFRQTYIGDTMTSLMEQALHGSDGVLGRLTIDNAARKVGKGISKVSSTIRTKVNESKLAKNESKLEKLEEFKSLKEEEASLRQRRDELWHKNKETSGNLFLEDEAELEDIDTKLQELDKLTRDNIAGIDKEKIERSIAREKDRLGIGDGSSNSHKIGEKSEKIGNFINQNLRLEKINNEIAKGIFYTKNTLKNAGLQTINSGKKIIDKTKNKYNNMYSIYHEDRAEDIAYKKSNIRHLKKQNSKLEFGSRIFNKDSIDELEKQIQTNKTNISKLEKQKSFIENMNILGEDTKLIEIQEKILKLENENIKYNNKLNAKKIEFMNNYYTIEKQKQEVDKYYTDYDKKDKDK